MSALPPKPSGQRPKTPVKQLLEGLPPAQRRRLARGPSAAPKPRNGFTKDAPQLLSAQSVPPEGSTRSDPFLFRFLASCFDVFLHIVFFLARQIFFSSPHSPLDNSFCTSQLARRRTISDSGTWEPAPPPPGEERAVKPAPRPPISPERQRRSTSPASILRGRIQGSRIKNWQNLQANGIGSLFISHGKCRASRIFRTTHAHVLSATPHIC